MPLARVFGNAPDASTAQVATIGRSVSDPPILRATNEVGETYDDPSEDLLFELLDELGEENTFLIVDRLESGREGHFMQVVLGADGSYVVEYRHGDPESHHGTSASSMRDVHEALTKWAFDLPGWNESFAWTRVTY